MSTVTIVSWNLNHWQQSADERARAWDHISGALVGAIAWDVALLQECIVPDAWPHPTTWRAVDAQVWGTAVVTRTGSLEDVALEDDSHPGCIVAADVTLGERVITVASLYGRQEKQ